MKFGGIQKTSLIDFPDTVATVLFTPGCNLRCPFCHNWRLVVDPKPPFIDEKTILEVLESRKKYVDAVVITGGEPTLHKQLPRFIRKLKESRFKVKLDSNGFFPQTLEKCLQWVDYVAVDVKTSLKKYKYLGARNTTELLRTFEILKRNKVPYEFRTTVVPGFVDEKDVHCIGRLINGATLLAFQQFVPEDPLDNAFKNLETYSQKVINRFAQIMKNYVENVILRL